MEQVITDLFMACVYVLQVIGGSPGEFGYGYYLANILIFVVMQPLLMITFLLLWLRERNLRSRLETFIAQS
jgi:hypothetical protein